jgi:hypothetical protein
MNKIGMFVCFLLFTSVALAQVDTVYADSPNKTASSIDLSERKNTAINVGLLMGGGSLIGFDLEFMPAKRVGIQAGAGISSFGAGLNYHFQEKINSSFISLMYWQQGWGENHYSSYVAPFFTFRAKKIFQAGIGLGYIVSKGPKILETKYADTDVTLLFNVGVFFPF